MNANYRPVNLYNHVDYRRICGDCRYSQEMIIANFFVILHLATIVVKMASKMTTQLARRLTIPNHTFFLLGPRGVGKSSWLRHHFPDALWFNLLLTDTYLELLNDPSIFRRRVEASSAEWVVIDEVQLLPPLLNEVHDLLARFGTRYKFALSGSSARKLRSGNANLLAGRALDLRMFPLCSSELGDDFDLDRALAHGTLPSAYLNPTFSILNLESYSRTYLEEEIQREAAVRQLDSFSRFLKAAALLNGNTVNATTVARECGVSRPTVTNYFEICVATLIGCFLPSWQPRLKMREATHPKFYLFDTGVVRALSGFLRAPVTELESGILLETFVLQELRSCICYRDTGGTLSYYRTRGGSEVDFVWTLGNYSIGIEVKSSKTWRSSNGSALRELLQQKYIDRAIGIYRGAARELDRGVTVYPVAEFLSELWEGRILGIAK